MNLKTHVMMKTIFILFWGVILLSRPEASQFVEDANRLKSEHRLPASEEVYEAGDYIIQRLREMGVDSVFKQRFSTSKLEFVQAGLEIISVPENNGRTRDQSDTTNEDIQANKGPLFIASDTSEAVLMRPNPVVTLEGDTIENIKTGSMLPLQPMKPNGFLPPNTPKNGIVGEIIHAGKGNLEEYGAKSVQGKIVVLDYNCGENWLTAFRLGAKAIIFVSDEPPEGDNFHGMETEMQFLRYYYPGSRTDLPENTKVKIISRVTWLPAIARNVYGWIEGTDPEFHLGKPEVMILSVPLDSYGEVPWMSPGGRKTANLAGMLKIAESLVNNRPRRNVLLAFYDMEAFGHMGASKMYRVLDILDNRMKASRIENRQAALEEEQELLDTLLAMMTAPNPVLLENSDYKKIYEERLKNRAAFQSYYISDELRVLREQTIELEEDSPKLKELEKEIFKLDSIKDIWSDLRRGFNNQDPELNKNPFLATVIEEEKERTLRRNEEMKFEFIALNDDKTLKNIAGNSWISFHLSCMINDKSPRWGFAAGGDSYLMSGNPDDNIRMLEQFGFALQNNPNSGINHFDTTTVGIRISSKYFVPGMFTYSGELASLTGAYHFAAITIQDQMIREGTPADKLENLNLDVMETQFNELTELIHLAGNGEDFSIPRSIESKVHLYQEIKWENNEPQGFSTNERRSGSEFQSREAPGVTIRINPQWPSVVDLHYDIQKIPAYNHFQIVRSNANGFFGYGPTFSKDNGMAMGAKFAPDGTITLMTDRGEGGYGGTAKSSWGDAQTLELEAIPVLGATVLPPQLDPEPITPYDGRANSKLSKNNVFGSETWQGAFQWQFSNELESFKLFGGEFNKAARYPSLTWLNNGPEKAEFGEIEDPMGQGMPTLPIEDWIWPDASKRSAVDLWRLNETRLSVMRSRGILNSSLEELHGRSEDLLIDSDSAQSLLRKEALAVAGFLSERPVHLRARFAMKDLVTSVLFLLVLTLPFAFVLERLLMSFTSIYKMLGGFAFFFIVTFMILFFTHPAFALSATPIVIFLGFTVLLLSGTVIYLIIQKFQAELKVLQGLKGSVHSADVSRFGTILTAMSMGLSAMRRRPLRTTLTAITIVLLTFTILCFASFDTSTGVQKTFIGPLPDYSATMMHKLHLDQIGPFTGDIAQGLWQNEENEVFVRYWKPVVNVKKSEFESKQYLNATLISNQNLTLHSKSEALIGISEKEISLRPDLSFLLPETPEGQWTVITKLIARQLDVGVGDTVVISGKKIKVTNIVEASELSGLRDMDGTALIPKTIEMPEISSAATQDVGQPTTDDITKEEVSFSSVILVSSRLAAKIGATPRIISVYGQDNKKLLETGKEIARIFTVNTFATGDDGVYRLSLSEKAQAKGLGDLVFPIVLGGLVILGTMLGSVADREREIYTFSALGLAPSHVASLFFAEAIVYAVLGGLGGYLLAQGFTAVLTFFSQYGWVQVPEINYSSTNAIFTIILVMIVVVLSSVYPALKASKSANPGVIRSWKMPVPDGDSFNFSFPFTVSSYDITGVVSFLQEHFERFADTSLGTFMAIDPTIIKGEGNSLGIEAKLTLAPFELGVTQYFRLISAPSEIPGIDEVRIHIERLSGQPGDWQRLNKSFFRDLRQQFLIWRALPKETMELYRDRTLRWLKENEKTAESNLV